MKEANLICAVLEDFTTIEVVFTRGAADLRAAQKTYTYKVPLSMGLTKDDLVLIDAPKGLTVVQVGVVHDAPQIDFDSDFEYKWVVQKIDTTEYKALLARDAELKQKLQRNRWEHTRKQVLEGLNYTVALEKKDG